MIPLNFVAFSVLVFSVHSARIPQGRIVGGKDVKIDDVPYQASLVLYGEHFCGGSIIREDLILTAASCLTDNLKDNIGFKVRIGNDEREFGGHLIPVERFVKYSNSSTIAGSDIGLVFVAALMSYDSPKVKIIALPTNMDVPAGTVAEISGWGFLSETGGKPDALQRAEVEIIDHDDCKNLYPGLLSDYAICAGNLAGGVDSCQLDVGGPLVADGILIGVNSWGFGCGRPNKPGIYASVYPVVEWIHKTATIEMN